jgi:hypothetical protein
MLKSVSPGILVLIVVSFFLGKSGASHHKALVITFALAIAAPVSLTIYSFSFETDSTLVPDYRQPDRGTACRKSVSAATEMNVQAEQMKNV